MESNLTNELLQAIVAATEEQKRAALRLLRGEQTVQPALPATEPYLTLREVGRRLNVSPCSLWRWGVPGHELGGRRRFRISEVLAYLDSAEFRLRAKSLMTEREANRRRKET